MSEENSILDVVVRINAQSTEAVDVTEDELIEVIQKVAGFHRNKTFAYYDQNDIEGEVWCICLKQLGRYEPDRGNGHDSLNSIERWLNKVVRNRLHNLYRDRYSSVNEEFRKARMNIMNSLPFDAVDVSRESSMCDYREDYLSHLIYDELYEFIESRLPDNLQELFYDCVFGENITSYYKGKLKTAILPILEEWEEINSDE